MTKPKDQKPKKEPSNIQTSTTLGYDFDAAFKRGLEALDARIALVGKAQFEAETGAQLRELQDKGYRM